MVQCPVCKKTFKKDGLERHITVKHPEYRAEHPLRHEVEQIAEPELSRADPLEELLNETNILKQHISERTVSEEEATKQAREIKAKLLKLQAEPVHKPAPTQKHKKRSLPPDEKAKPGLLGRITNIFTDEVENEPQPKMRKLKKQPGPKPEPKVEVVPEPEKPAEMKDPEGALDMILRMPAIIIVFGTFIYFWTHPATVRAIAEHPVTEFYIYLLSTINAPISLIILGLTATMMYLVGSVIYKFAWRMIFPDLQIKSYKEVPIYGRSLDGKWVQVDVKRIFIPPTRRGRIYLMIGRGFWDRWYRKRYGRPKPDVVTIYFRDFARTRNPFANPFKVLASCDKGYLNDPDSTRLYRDGFFRRTLIATHLRRDTDDNQTVYWFENDPYEYKPSESKPYVNTHTNLIQLGLGKVSEACGMDSSIQKDQMRNSVSYLPKQLILEDKAMTELKQTVMGKAEK